MKDNNDGFELDFEDNITDLTVTERQHEIGKNGTNFDIYGMYQPGRVYESEAEAIAAKRAARLKSKEKSENIVNVLFNIAIWSFVCLAAVFRIFDAFGYSGSYMAKNFLMPILIIDSIFYKIVVVIDICMMYSRYRRISLFLSGFLFLPVYPYVRNSIRGKSRFFPVIWMVLFFITFYPILNILIKHGFLTHLWIKLLK